MQEIYKGQDFKTEEVENTQPKVNIIKTETSYELELAAPGYSKEDFNIELKDDKLILSAQEKSKETTNYTRREFTLTGFKRVFSISRNEINRNDITAQYENGILTLQLPLNKEAVSVNKKINIS
jgi:HSP20 family protein